jgi:heme A synthase
MVTAVLGLGFIALVIGAWRRRGARQERRDLARVFTPSGFSEIYRSAAPVWRATVWAVVFFVVEVVIGAMLVVFGWVENDASIGRVIADGVHLVNTFALVGALVLVVFHAAGGGPLRVDGSRLSHKLVLGGAAVVTLIGITGAINSLADTLYFAEEVDVDETPIAALLVAIRGIHPVVAIGGGIGLFLIARHLADGASPGVRRLALGIQAVVWAQFVIGFLNIVLLTPLESQVVHLLAAHGLWILFVFLGARITELPSAVGETVET